MNDAWIEVCRAGEIEAEAGIHESVSRSQEKNLAGLSPLLPES
jgi:hypothetical protein